MCEIQRMVNYSLETKSDTMQIIENRSIHIYVLHSEENLNLALATIPRKILSGHRMYSVGKLFACSTMNKESISPHIDPPGFQVVVLSDELVAILNDMLFGKDLYKLHIFP